MSGAENPELLAPGKRITAETLRELTGAATPQFALQLRDRVNALVAGLADDDPARAEAQRQVERLELLAQEGQATGHIQDHEQPLPSLTLDPKLTDSGLG